MTDSTAILSTTPPPAALLSLERLVEHALAGFTRERFRGEIYDYARSIWLGAGYLIPEGNVCRNCRARGIAHCRHFEIDTARQLVGPFKALNDPNVRTVMLLKAVQTLGSLVWDLALHYFIVHSPFMKIKVFIDSQEKVRRYCDDRLMPTLKRNPDIAPMLPTGAARFDETKSAIFFANGKSIEVLPLNESTASSLSADVVVIDELWEHGADGLGQKAIDRTKQARAAGRVKIFVVGQAGRKDEDQDRLWQKLHKRVRLSWACPSCGGRQTFGEHGPAVERPADFVPRLPREMVESGWLMVDGKPVPPSTLNPQLSTIWKPPTPGTFAGLKTPKRHEELTTPEEVKAAAAQAFLECYWCGHHIHDTPAERAALMATYEQEYREAGAGGLFTPEEFEVGFWNPDPASVTIRFAETMAEYLEAKKVDAELGNRQRLMDFYMNRWVTAWDNQLSVRSAERPAASVYDVMEKIPGERCRISATDIQFKLTHMVYLAVAVGDGVPPRVLHAEWVKPPAGLTDHQAAEHCKARVRELDKKFGIQQQNSMKDAAHEPGLVREWAAEDAVFTRIQEGRRVVSKWVSYGLLLGDDRPSYRWSHPGRKDTWERFKQFHWTEVDAIKDGKRVRIPIHHRQWSNPSIKEIAERWRDGAGAPKLVIHDDFLQDTSKDGLWAQLTSEHKMPWKGHPGKLRYDNEGRPNHFWDCWCMIVVRMDELGFLNSFGAPPEDEEKAES